MAFDYASLTPLLGKVVRVYKGGPESKVGRLISITASYALVETFDEGLTYYNMRHIKSITEDLNQAAYPPSSLSPENTPLLSDFNAVLQSLINKLVRIDRGGPESRKGRLLYVGPDFFVIWTKEDGILYYQTWHVKSISEVRQKNKQQNAGNTDAQNSDENSTEDANSTENENGNASEPNIILNAPTYVEGYDFTALLGNLKNRWVKINRGGPESVEGVVTDVEGGLVTIVNKKELFRIATSHIRNVSYLDNNGLLIGGSEGGNWAQDGNDNSGNSNSNGRSGNSNSSGRSGNSNSSGRSGKSSSSGRSGKSNSSSGNSGGSNSSSGNNRGSSNSNGNSGRSSNSNGSNQGATASTASGSNRRNFRTNGTKRRSSMRSGNVQVMNHYTKYKSIRVLRNDLGVKAVWVRV